MRNCSIKNIIIGRPGKAKESYENIEIYLTRMMLLKAAKANLVKQGQTVAIDNFSMNRPQG